MSARRKAGVGAIAFPLLVVAALTLADAQGGSFDAAAVARFTDAGHRSAVIGSLGLMALAAAVLAFTSAHVTDTYLAAGWHRRVVWSTTVIAVGALLTGWVVMLAPSFTVSLGGGPPTQPAVAYTFVEAGLGVFLLGGMAIGAGLIAFAHGAAQIPTWVRTLNAIVGVVGLASIAFEPFLVVLLWGLAAGIWLVVSRGHAPAAAPLSAKG